MTDLIGQTIGQYVVLEEIGRGGMATVYRAFQLKIGRDVAIKVLPAAFTHDQTFLARFSREVELAARLQHTRILPVYDYGEYEGQPYIVSAYMPGGNLEERIAEEVLPLDEVVRLVSQIAEGLDYLHGEGVIHRDFKPSNVLLDASGSAFLSDFGIARVQEATAQLTGTGMIGTPAYMAPELFSTGDATPASDIYALGVTLYAMLAGSQPFDAETPAQHMRAHLEKPVPDIRRTRPDLPPGVQRVIATTLAKDPAMRYRSAGEMAAALKQVVYPAPVKAAAKKPRSIPIWPLAAMSGLVVLGIIAVAVFFALRGGTAAQPEPTAPVVVAAVTNTAPPTDASTPTETPTPSPTPIPVIGGGTGILGFNMSGLGYTIDVSCVLAGGAGCNANPGILPEIGGLTPYFGKWSPDGRSIAFISGDPLAFDTHLAVASLDTSKLAVLDKVAEFGFGGSPFDWSPDGTKIVFLHDPDVGWKWVCIDWDEITNQCRGDMLNLRLVAPSLWLADVTCMKSGAEGCASLLINNGDGISNPIWAEDGTRIMFWSETGTTSGRGYIYSIEVGNQSLNQISDRQAQLFFLVWMPDGKRVVFFDNMLKMADLEHEQIVTLSPLPAPYGSSVSLSPDGRLLALSLYDEEAKSYELYVLDLTCLETGLDTCPNALRRLTDNDVDEGPPMWSLDGQWLAFTRARHTDVAATNSEERNTGIDVYVIQREDILAGEGDKTINITNVGIVDMSPPQWQPLPGN